MTKNYHLKQFKDSVKTHIQGLSKREYFDTDDYLNDVLPQVASSKFTHFPIVDEENMVQGVLSRRHLLNYQKKNVVLIDL